MAGRIAGGDLDTRLAERGPGEIGAPQRSFNTMARSLENRAELAASRARFVAAADSEMRANREQSGIDSVRQRPGLSHLLASVRCVVPGWLVVRLCHQDVQ